jgi:hypothetical protein
MAECPHCEYNKKRAQHWREEVYRLGGHPLPEREWVGLIPEEIDEIIENAIDKVDALIQTMDKLKEKNT